MTIINQVIVCTRNRQSEILRMIENLQKLKGVSGAEILVVDNSDHEEEMVTIQESIARYKNVKIIKSKPGLVNARNAALKNVHADYITFLDDDVEIPADFLQKLNKVFDLHPQIVGISPLISHPDNVAKIKSPPFLSGKISKWGSSYWFPLNYRSKKRIMESMWLPGCCMSYRAKAIKGLNFNSSLQNGPTGGYSLGEDVDFSMKVLKVGKLVCDLETVIQHNLSPVNRNKVEAIESGIGMWQGYLIRTTPRVTLFAVLSFDALSVMKNLVRISRSTDHNRNYKILTRIKSVLTELRHPKLGEKYE